MQRALILAPLLLSLAPAVFAAAVPAAPILTLPPARSMVLGSQGGAPSEVLLTNVVGAARSQVPGLPGVAFQPGAGTTHFDRVYGHPSGRWVLTALADLPAGEDECLLADGELVLREGDPAPWTGGAEDCGTLDRRCAISGRGDLVFATNTSASALDDYLPLRRAGTVPRWTHAAREGDPVPGLPFATLDDAIDSPLVLDDGRVGFAADGIDGVASTSEDEVLVLGDVVLLQEGVSVPDGQAGGGQRPLENLDRGAFWASLDGSAWMVVGDLEGPTDVDDVVIVDGAVVLQEGVPVPGGGFAEPVAPGGVHGAFMDGGGRWFARGSNASSGADWVVVDGAVVARTGAPITPGASERWDDVGYGDGFAALAGNRLGDRVVIGVTDDPDPARNTVVVLNGEHVVAREGDPVDLDGDGVAADGLYIETFGTDDALLTDALDLLTVVTLRDAGGTRRGQALLRQRLDPGLGVVTCAGVANSTGTGAGLIALGSAAVTDGDLQLRAVDLPPSAPVVFLVSRSPGLVMQPGGSLGQLCLGGAVGRFLARGQFGPASPAGVAAIAVDVAALPAGAGPGPSAPGDTLHFQAWYRDHLPAAPSTTNLTGALAVVLR
ncbi:MAG: hypothetical protein PVJ89_06305 [Planctomycetota bacterium]|jgi:hypothetical protein